jgi:signal recognition particle subunit SRP54
MFETLTGQHQEVFKNLRGYGKLSEANIAEALREVRIALLEADVNYDVARKFIDDVQAKALGAAVTKSVSPGQQIIKIIHDGMVALLGSSESALQISGSPAKILLVGLNGSGKTTTAGKLGLWLKSKGRSPMLVACDVYRPAAIEQLQTLGRQIDVPVFTKPGELDVPKIAGEAMRLAEIQNRNVLIFDSAGRHQIDEPLMQELVQLKKVVRPQEILLVADAATGQEAANVASKFHEKLELTGFILSRMDGDARGGAALSMNRLTGQPIKMVGTGEKSADFEVFYPDRMASRILGMGDIVSLVEKAQESVDAEKAAKLEKKLRKNEFTLQDFLEQLEEVQRMGPLENLLAMVPGAANVKNLSLPEKQLAGIKAIIQSMTHQERAHPEVLNARRRIRIAQGSGKTVSDVNDLLKRFATMRKMMKNVGRMQGLRGFSGGFPGIR